MSHCQFATPTLDAAYANPRAICVAMEDRTATQAHFALAFTVPAPQDIGLWPERREGMVSELQ
jgi:hypothetical protein